MCVCACVSVWCVLVWCSVLHFTKGARGRNGDGRGVECFKPGRRLLHKDAK